MTQLERIQEAIKRFKQVQEKHSEYGACDTEPDAIFQGLIYNAWTDNLEAGDIPYDANEWDLYYTREGSNEAAAELAEAACKVIELIWDTRLKDSKEVIEYLTQYCWRVG